MWRSAVALALVATTAASPEPPTDADAVVASLEDASPYPPLSRLGRWDGSTFVAVEQASIDAAKVIVVAHGWAPGLRDAYDRLQAASTELITIWDPELDDADGGPGDAALQPLIEAIARAQPDAAVLLFSWLDQSATAEDPFDARQGEAATEINGHRLAVALDQALAEDWAGELHLIGHSFGANVATTAALALDARPRQLTLMDSPDDELTRLGGAGNDLRYKLPRLGVGRSPATTFVDNYISELGVRYGDLPGLDLVVDVRLDPPPGSDPTARHDYPPRWYAEALAKGPVPRGTAPTGPWWSPLLGADPAGAGSYYVAEDQRDPTALTEVEGRSPTDVDDAIASPVVRLELATGGSDITLSEGRAVVEAGFTTSEDSLLLAFNVAFGGADEGATVTVAVDGRQRYMAVGPSHGDGRAGSFVLLWDVEPGQHRLTAALTGGGEGATATLSSLRIMEATDIVRNETEEQTTALVVTIVIGAALVVIVVIVGVALVARAMVRRRQARLS